MILYIIMDIICLQNIGGRARVVFIQIAKWADRRARTMRHAGSEYVFCLKCSHCCVYFSVLELPTGVPAATCSMSISQIMVAGWTMSGALMHGPHGSMPIVMT